MTLPSLEDSKDFFISYNQGDRAWAEWLAWTLEEVGYSVIIDAWDFRPGGNFALEMDRAMKRAERTIAVLSENYLNAVYTQSEWAAAFAKDPTSERRSLLTVRVMPCEPKGILGLITRIDVFDLDEATAQFKILELLKARAKPEQKPSFPGYTLDLKRIPFPGSQMQQTEIDLTAMFRGAFPQKAQDWSSRQRDLLQALQGEVQQRLADVLNDDVLMPLAMLEQPEQVDRAPLKPRRQLATADEVTDVETQPMLEVFCRSNRKLLILGDPGAGKTTTLLGLAQELLAGAIATPGTVLPIIFELSAWKDDWQPIRDWLKGQLKEMFNIQPKESEQWLAEKLLLPLLDGLDELGLERQQKCVAAINRFVAESAYPQVVVCCRNEEYREAGATLGELGGAVSLEPLGDGQIRRYLLNVGLGAMWEAIETQPEMGAMLADDAAGKPGILRVPLLLSIAAVAYEGRAFGSKGELIEAYVERRLSLDVRKAERRELKGRKWVHSDVRKEQEQVETLYYLAWLARTLKENFQTELLIEKMQPRCLHTSKQKWQYRLASGLSVGLILGLTVGLFFELSMLSFKLFRLIIGLKFVVEFGLDFLLLDLVDLALELIAGLIWGAILGLILGLPIGLILGLSDIEPTEVFGISISRKVGRKILRRLKRGTQIGFKLSVNLAFIFGLIVKVIYRLSHGLSSAILSGFIDGVIVGLITLLFGGLTFVLFVGAIYGAFFGVFDGLLHGLKQELMVRSRPNQGIWNSFQNMIWALLFAILSLVISLLLPFNNIEFSIWIILGCILISLNSGISFLQHFTLRFVLACNHLTPATSAFSTTAPRGVCYNG